MAVVSAVELVSRVPFVAAVYHLILVPVAVRSATVGLAAEQNICKLLPVGADGTVGAVLTTASVEGSEVHPAALVTVKL